VTTRVAVVTDSTADIPPALAERFDVHVVPLTLRLGSQTYEDRVSITPAQFMAEVSHADALPSTEQPSVARFHQLYLELGRTHDAIVSIHLSSRLSGTYQSARLARDQIDGRLAVAVLDSRSASMALGFPVLRAAALARSGAAFEEIVRAAELAIEQSHLVFLVDTLEYLRRGGRIGRAAEIVGSALQLKPILRIENGVVVPYARTRTRPRALATLATLVGEFPQVGNLAIMAGPGARDVRRLADALSRVCPPDRTIFTDLSPVLASHVGPGGLGVAVNEGPPLELGEMEDS